MCICLCAAACGRVNFSEQAPDATHTSTLFDFSSFDTCGPELELRGTAACSGGVLDLTPASPEATGYAWLASPYDVTTFSTLAMKIEMEMIPGTHGDGMVVMFSADPRGVEANGTGGLGLGYGGTAPSTAVELDTVQNSSNSDPSNDHVGIDIDGSVQSVVTADLAFDMVAVPSFTVWIDYERATDRLAVSVSDTKLKPVSSMIATGNALQRLGSVWIGVAGACGSLDEENRVLAWSATITR